MTDSDIDCKGADGIELKFREVECGKGSLSVKTGDISIQESIVPKDTVKPYEYHKEYKRVSFETFYTATELTDCPITDCIMYNGIMSPLSLCDRIADLSNS